MDNKTTNKVRECEPLPFTNSECMLYLPPSLTLRSNGNVCDEYNPLTSQFIQRIGEDGSILDNPIASKVKSIVVHNDSIKYGYSLPNGVTDLYHPQTETYEQLIESTTLDGSEEWAKTNQTTYTTTFVGAKSDTSLEIFTMKEEVKEITIINDRLTITFNDNSYVVTNNLTLNAFKVWLQSNNIEFKYELKYEEYRKMTLEELDFNEFHSDSLVGSKSSTITQATKDDSVFAPITYQAKSNNRFELPLLESDVDYTIRYEGETTGVSLGGETITSVESNSVVQGGVGKVALFDSVVDELMLVKGDVRKQTLPQFRGLLNTKSPTIATMATNLIGECINPLERHRKYRSLLKPNTRYTLNYKNADGSSTSDGRVYLKNGEVEIISYGYNHQLRFTTPSETNETTMLVIDSWDNELAVLLLEGEEPLGISLEQIMQNPCVELSLGYSPDLELLSVGGVCDIVDCKKNKVERHCMKLMLDGDEEIGTHFIKGNVFHFTIHRNIVDKLIDGEVDIHKSSVCNVLKYCGLTMEQEDGEGFGIDENNLQVQISLKRLSEPTKEGLKQYLQTNPLTFVVPLTNPKISLVEGVVENKEGDKKHLVYIGENNTIINTTSEELFPNSELAYFTNGGQVEFVTLQGEGKELANVKANSTIQRASVNGETLMNLVESYDGGGEYWRATAKYPFVFGKQYLIRILDCPLKILQSQVIVKGQGYRYTGFKENVPWASNNEGVPYNQVELRLQNTDGTTPAMEQLREVKVLILEYRDGMEHWNIPYFEGMATVKNPTLELFENESTVKDWRFIKKATLTTPNNFELLGVGNARDTLNLLNGRLVRNVGMARLASVPNDAWGSFSPNGVNGATPNTANINMKKANFNKYFPPYFDSYHDGKHATSNLLQHQDTTYGKEFECFALHSDGTQSLQVSLSHTRFGGDLTKEKMIQLIKELDIVIIYRLHTPTIDMVDLVLTQEVEEKGKDLNYLKESVGRLISNGTLPKFSYKLQSTNNYHAKDLKPNTTYTIYSDTESSVVNIGGKSNILLHSPQLVTSGNDGKNVRFEGVANDIVVIEGDVVNQVVPYFTGKIDVVNPIVKTIGGNNSNTVQTSVTLRSVNRVRDTYDMNTGVLTKRISDNHEILDYPQTIAIPCDTPRIYSQGRIELSNNSDLSLLPRFEYSGKSPNFYPLAVDKNTTYTLKFDNTTNGGVTLGGTTVGTNGNQIITTKNNTLQGVLFERDLGIDNLMVIRGDVRDVPMSYFQGIKNVVNPTITLDNGGGESNSLTLTLTMRSLPNGTKDELNLVTGDYVQRLDERPYQEGDIESDNLLTDGVTTIYPLSSPRRRRLNLEWSNGVLKAFEGTTNVTSEAEMLKPYLVVKLATSTLEDLLSKLKEENNGLLETVDKLEEDNLTTMIAVTEVFETVLVMLPFRMDEGISMGSTLKGGGSQMVEVYVTLILKGKKTIDQVPVVIRSQVEQMLKDLQTL